jgi:hypothetical protein
MSLWIAATQAFVGEMSFQGPRMSEKTICH